MLALSCLLIPCDFTSHVGYHDKSSQPFFVLLRPRRHTFDSALMIEMRAIYHPRSCSHQRVAQKNLLRTSLFFCACCHTYHIGLASAANPCYNEANFFLVLLHLLLSLPWKSSRELFRCLGAIAAWFGVRTPVQHAIFSGWVSVVTGLMEAGLSLLAGEKSLHSMFVRARVEPPLPALVAVQEVVLADADCADCSPVVRYVLTELDAATGKRSVVMANSVLNRSR